MTRSFRVRLFYVTTLAVGLVLSPSALPAQAQPQQSDSGFDVPILTERDWSDEVPAHISIVDGDAWMHRDGTNEAAGLNTPLLSGDRLQTGRGRMEVVFADGSLLALDDQTDVAFLSDDLLRVDSGRVHISLARSAAGSGYRVDAAGTTTLLQPAGEYRIQVDSRTGAAPTVRVLTIRGAAEVTSAQETTVVRAGYEASATAQLAPSLPYAVSVSGMDGFDDWWRVQRDDRVAIDTARHLPAEVSYYGGVLDRSGDWQYEPTHGYVWYPRVDAGWQPYSVGRWSFVGSYGWVWIGADRWSWPTHHYGRWGYSGRRYYWIPGRNWAPAWVSWTSTPDYVGWSPIGYDNRPLVSINIGFSTGWRGWTYAPARHFHGRVVVTNRVRDRYFPGRDSRFERDYRGPLRPSGIVTRNNGLRGPSFAVPRAGAVRRVTDINRAPSDRMNTDRRSPAAPVLRGGPSQTQSPGRPRTAGGTTTPTRPTTVDRDPFRRPQTVAPSARNRDRQGSTPQRSPAPGVGDSPRTERMPVERTRPGAAPRGGQVRPMPSQPAEREMRSIPSTTTGRPTRTMPASREPDEGRPAPTRFPSNPGVNRERPAPSRERAAPAASRERATPGTTRERATPSSAPRVQSPRAPERQRPQESRSGDSGSGSRARARAR